MTRLLYLHTEVRREGRGRDPTHRHWRFDIPMNCAAAMCFCHMAPPPALVPPSPARASLAGPSSPRHCRHMLGNAMFEHAFGQRLDQHENRSTACHSNRLIDHHQQSQAAPVVFARFHKIAAPDVIAMLQPQPDRSHLLATIARAASAWSETSSLPAARCAAPDRCPLAG